MAWYNAELLLWSYHHTVLLIFQNCSLAVVGEGEDLQIFDDDQVAPYLEGLDQEERRGGAGAKEAGEEPAEAADEGGDQPPPAPPAEVGRTTCINSSDFKSYEIEAFCDCYYYLISLKISCVYCPLLP